MKDTKSSKKKNKPISITPSPPEKAAPVPVNDDETAISECGEKVQVEKNNSNTPTKVSTMKADKKELREKISEY